MCLAIPLKVEEVKDNMAICEGNKEVDVSLIGAKVKPGCYLLVHDDLAVNTLPNGEAEKIKEMVGTCHHQHSHEHNHPHSHSH